MYLNSKTHTHAQKKEIKIIKKGKITLLEKFISELEKAMNKVRELKKFLQSKIK